MLLITSRCACPEKLAPQSQSRLAKMAEDRLRTNPYRTLRKVRCTCRDGVLYLRGSVPTYYLKQLAQEAVAEVDGVHRIKNLIDVLSPACRSRSG
jgi:osmotically-inducible protein OsmY